MMETSSTPSPKRKWLLTLWRYLQSAGLVLLATLISIPIHFQIDAVNLVMLYLAAVVVVAVRLGRGPAILASLLSVLTFDFFLIEPRLSFTVADTQYLLTFLGLLIVGLVISTSVARVARQVEIIRQREAHTAALNSLSKDLTSALNLDNMLHSVVHHIFQSFACRVLVLLPSENGLRLAADSIHTTEIGATVSLTPEETQRAEQIYRSAPQYHHSFPSETPPGYSSGIRFLPLRTSLGVGVLGIDTGENSDLLTDKSQRTLLQGFANLAALAIERAHLAEQASQAEILKDIERLQTALLNSISHELRTPLVSITGALSSLSEAASAENGNPQERAARKEIIETAYEDARRMNLLVGNLLDMSRLESGTLKLNLEPCDLEDLVGISLEHFSQQYPARRVDAHLPDGLPLLDLDAALMVEVLVNLLANAAKYSPIDTPIELSIQKTNDLLEIAIHDHGEGAPPEDLEHLFDKFFRSATVRHTGGLGLGLSISKGFIEAHGGSIEARNRPSGGLSVLIYLPIPKKADQHG
jgi:two-component system sensor histidine kinase KdpD